MWHQLNKRQFAPLVLLLTPVIGCGSGGPTSGDPATTVVVGEVVAIENMVAVDGGITIGIATGDGQSEILEFPSLFTSPPPDDATLNLYDLVRRVEVADVVRAEGVRSATGLALTSLTILSGRH